ncbi:hypothetical protein ZWY2020_051076 [Hordeum vulgare]|nr:hypothetical protein ZWY2020_051076 [Hordeum vulgare]
MLAAGDARSAQAPLPRPPARHPPVSLPRPGPDRLPHLPRRPPRQEPCPPHEAPQAALPPPPLRRWPPSTAVVEDSSLPLSPEPSSPVAVEPGSSAPVARPKGAAFLRPRPQLLALGGAVALALLAVWSEGTVAAFAVASLLLL